jgi:hypothetical protein
MSSDDEPTKIGVSPRGVTQSPFCGRSPAARQ